MPRVKDKVPCAAPELIILVEGADLEARGAFHDAVFGVEQRGAHDLSIPGRMALTKIHQSPDSRGRNAQQDELAPFFFLSLVPGRRQPLFGQKERGPQIRFFVL